MPTRTQTWLFGALGAAGLAVFAGLGFVLRRAPESAVASEAPAPSIATPEPARGLPTALAQRSGEINGVRVVRRATPERRRERVAPAEAEPAVVSEGLRLLDTPLERAPEFPVAPAATLPAPEPSWQAPFGRLLRCTLVLTVESTSESVPVVALVAEDQWWDGKRVIPAGTEVHGTARVDRSRDRVFTDRDWVLVLPGQETRAHGRELRLRGVALDRDASEEGVTWSLTDGSYGLRGTVLRSGSLEAARALATTFLSAAAGSLADTSQDLLGRTQQEPTLRTAVAEGSRAALDRLAARMLQEVERNGSYLRVPAGKQFYLYVEQSLNNAVTAEPSATTATLTDP